jgi:PhnB protein
MATKVLPVPSGYHSLTPYISVNDAAKAIEFYKKAFGAKETGRITMPDGSIGHCEMEIGDSKIMIADENKQWGNLSPLTLGGSPVSLCLYVNNVDEVFDRAIKAGATVLGNMEVRDQFHGDRAGTLTDPFGHKWSIMTHIEDVSFKEMQKRTDALFSGNKVTPESAGSDITVHISIKAPVEKVWKLWIYPEHIKNWCYASDDWYVPDATNNLKTNGKFTTRMAAKDGSAGFDFEGIYTEIKEFKNIKYTISDGRSVAVAFNEKNGITEVTETFKAENINSDKAQQNGWQAILNNFKKYVEKQP